jgi:hypothetical protein
MVRIQSATQLARIGDDENLRPDLIPGGNANPVIGNPEHYFDISHSPGLANVDFSIFKNIDIETSRIQFRIEAFNLFNRANFRNPDMTAFIDEKPNPTAGRITETRTPARQIQIGLRFTF